MLHLAYEPIVALLYPARDDGGAKLGFQITSGSNIT